MTGKEFLRAVSNGEADILQILLEILEDTRTSYCIIGGLAVNAYVEPVVSLDLDVVVAVMSIDVVCERAAEQMLKVERFPHSVNLTSGRSDLRIQIQTDERYQAFIPQAQSKQVLGYSMRVAQLEDVLRGKLWACQDETRRRSKRQKDLADISRLVEAHPALAEALPSEIRKLVE